MCHRFLTKRQILQYTYLAENTSGVPCRDIKHIISDARMEPLRMMRAAEFFMKMPTTDGNDFTILYNGET